MSNEGWAGGRVGVVCGVVLCLFGFLGGVTADSVANNTLTLGVQFKALWWSEEQMEGLDPNAPPPKQTEVRLQRWEYSDPIGVPHPDKFTVVVTIANHSTQSLELQLHGLPRWKIGSIRREQGATWQTAQKLPPLGPLRLIAGEILTVRFADIDLKAIQDRLFKQDKWPWLFEIEMLASTPGKTKPVLAKTVAQLPIRPGDCFSGTRRSHSNTWTLPPLLSSNFVAVA